MVLEGGSIALAAIRAGRTTFAGNVRSGRAISPLTLVTIGPLHRNYDFDDLYRECFGIPPHKGLDNSDPDRAAEALRDTLEYLGHLTDRGHPARQAPSCSSTAHSGSPARTTNRSSPTS